MKRIEMLIKMTRIIADTCGYDAAKSIARDILNMQEKAGMLPPSILQEVPSDEVLVPGDIPLRNGKFGTPVNRWEEE